MQVTIGIKHAARELTIETTASQEEILDAVSGAATADVTLSDDKGRKVFIPAGSPLRTASASACERHRHSPAQTDPHRH